MMNPRKEIFEFIYRHLISPMAQGKGFYRFASGRFAEAASILEKDFQRYPNQRNDEVNQSILGRCYLELNQLGKALQVLAESYAKYQRNKGKHSDQEYLKSYRETVLAYSRTLRAAGRLDESEKVLNILKEDSN